MSSLSLSPFALSLSKGSVGQLCFDKLSTNGVGEINHAR
jgi:hypothetical protein